MDYVGLSPSQQEMVVCAIPAAIKYGVPANVILAIAEQEGGKPDQWSRNENGTYDVGPLQFNTSYLRELAKFGISAADVAGQGCYSYDLAAWRIKKHVVEDKGDFWTKVANYHSRTNQYNRRYQLAIMPKAAKWGDWLIANVTTHDVTDVVAGKR